MDPLREQLADAHARLGVVERERDRLRHDLVEADRLAEELAAERDGLRRRVAELEQAVAGFERSFAIRLRGLLHRLPGYGRVARRVWGRDG